MSIRDQMNPKREITVNKYSNLIDAFNRLRISAPTILFDSQLQYDRRLEHWFEKSNTSATITHLSSESAVELGVTADSMTAIRQSRGYFRYQPGKSQLILATFGGAQSQTGVNKYVGYGDDDNGLFLKVDGTGAKFVKRTKTSGTVVDTEVPQVEWNIDRMNGTGPSRCILDFSKVQILAIDLEWLGVGRVRMGFVIDGTIIACHEFVQANVGTEVYMQSANLPLRYEIQSTAATSSATLKQICASVMSEGGDAIPAGGPRAISNDDVLRNVTSEMVVLSIRPRSTFKGKVNRAHLPLSGFDVFSQDSDIHYHVVYGGEINSSSAGWLPVSTAWSGMEYCATGVSNTGGFIVDEGYIPANTQGLQSYGAGEQKAFHQQLHLALDIDGNHPTVANAGLSDQLSVVIEPVSGDSDCGVVIHWVEEF